jgi:hypothetical protein
MQEQVKDQFIDEDIPDNDDLAENDSDVEEVKPRRSAPRLLPTWLIIVAIVLLVLIVLFTIFGVGTLMQHPPLKESFNGSWSVAQWLKSTSLALAAA